MGDPKLFDKLGSIQTISDTERELFLIKCLQDYGCKNYTLVVFFESLKKQFTVKA